MIRLVQTCFACPEQYDAFDGNGKRVGYIRLRGGRFRVQCPDIGGEDVFEHIFAHDWYKGMFEDEQERKAFLGTACRRIEAWALQNVEDFERDYYRIVPEDSDEAKKLLLGEAA